MIFCFGSFVLKYISSAEFNFCFAEVKFSLIISIVLTVYFCVQICFISFSFEKETEPRREFIIPGKTTYILDVGEMSEAAILWLAVKGFPTNGTVVASPFDEQLLNLYGRRNDKKIYEIS